MMPEERIKANVQKALGQQKTKPIKKQNLFVDNVCKSTSRTRSTDLAEVIEICSGLPGISDPTAAALTLICCHNNTQVRQHIKERAGEEIGAITAEQISLATGEEFSALDIAMTITELMTVGVLSIDEEGYYRCVLYATE